ncbi:alpha/beta hydrolase [Streptomyces sp. WAC 06783]|uniref:alpha/beta hydrolase n=1 Tax=Streptomyces sp. WAC 06783 TaxID=2203211 RepID=UPI000F74B2F7|nr:alpha/beta hydrolase [Streptomyces sp. WAC 06783]RSO08171.1 alpha/beta hydrolase [Streptomyces sp. WAC 06783]
MAPELAPVLEQLPPMLDPYADIAGTRAGLHTLACHFPADRTGVESERFGVPRPDGSELAVEVYRPVGAPGASPGGPGPLPYEHGPLPYEPDPLPGVLQFHGGGYTFGQAPPGEDRTAIELVRAVGAAVVSVEYRLAPEHPCPAAVEDCFLALEWTAGQAAALGIDPARLAVSGQSAGGGLAAAVALMARDRGGPALVHQSLVVPDLDDSAGTRPTPADDDPRLPDGAFVQRGWRHYVPEGAGTHPYAAAARATDLRGLPGACVVVCGLDPLRDTGLAYARRLADAGVPVALHYVPGAWHGFEMFAPETRLARETTAYWTGRLRAALHGGREGGSEEGPGSGLTPRPSSAAPA